MKRLWCTLFSIFFVFMASKSSWAVSDCSRSANVIADPVSLSYLQSQGQDGMFMISGVWHEKTLPNFVNCRATDVGVRHDSVIGTTRNSIGTYTFAGQKYAIFKTTNANVGIIYEFGYLGEGYKPVMNLSSSSKASFMGTGGPVMKDLSYHFRYIALGRLPNGNVMLPGVGVIDSIVIALYQGSIDLNRIYASDPSVNITVNTTSCSLKAPSVVSLKKSNLSLMPTVGSVAEGSTFQVGVVCGSSYAPYKVLYSMGDAFSPGNQTSMLTVGNVAGSAFGVALQVLDNDKPIVFAPDSAAPASKGQLGSMSTQGGSLSKPLSVRYIRTGKMIPGTVRAGVTVTLSYE